MLHTTIYITGLNPIKSPSSEATSFRRVDVSTLENGRKAQSSSCLTICWLSPPEWSYVGRSISNQEFITGFTDHMVQHYCKRTSQDVDWWRYFTLGWNWNRRELVRTRKMVNQRTQPVWCTWEVSFLKVCISLTDGRVVSGGRWRMME